MKHRTSSGGRPPSQTDRAVPCAELPLARHLRSREARGRTSATSPGSGPAAPAPTDRSFMGHTHTPVAHHVPTARSPALQRRRRCPPPPSSPKVDSPPALANLHHALRSHVVARHSIASPLGIHTPIAHAIASLERAHARTHARGDSRHQPAQPSSPNTLRR